ncbi:DUF4186 domain-containing protein [Herbaspirillum robiniae]|uniref:DUF4186 domain-containing protein n=1 Tax=Herbaspirillum robiniae TaxID=2014887 RepID=A0ABX2LWA8_9BURK|nr:DUF4186 domain-containing protein [Herbaspirillum robiniae]NUU01465.1 DUF4186 domain-containing protein [Herbaspirillum robiniae]
MDDAHDTAPDHSPSRDERNCGQALARLARSRFRSGFRLKPAELRYLLQHGGDVLARHAAQFIGQRLAPAMPVNDGKQTPWRGHPVFVAQHATATCCRACLAKWHGMPPGLALTKEQQDYVVSLISAWLARQAQGKVFDEVVRGERELGEKAVGRRRKGVHHEPGMITAGRQGQDAGQEGDDQNRQSSLF